MGDKKKPDNVVFNLKTEKYDAALKPYPTNVGAPVITTTDTIAWKNNSIHKLNHKVQTRYLEIKAQYEQLMKEFPHNFVGLSDHTLDNISSYSAIALGAKIIERHFTDTRKRSGPDIVCSMDEKSCKELIEGSELIWKMRGGKKKPTEEEQVTIDFAFATVCTIAPIQKGEVFTKENIWVKRPGTGSILAEHFESILGKKAIRNIENDEQLTWKDIK